MEATMNSLSHQILAWTETQSEGQPISAKGLLHLGNRAAVDQALARLARRGALMRAARGLYIRPVETRFGQRAPAAEKVAQAIGRALGETVVQSGAGAANKLGLTTQVPVRPVYLTSGPSRRLHLGKQLVELRHAKPWQLVEPHTNAGEALRALAWMGRSQSRAASAKLVSKLTSEEVQVLACLRTALPGWLAQSVSEAMVADG
jgi:hypothetical protein